MVMWLALLGIGQRCLVLRLLLQSFQCIVVLIDLHVHILRLAHNVLVRLLVILLIGVCDDLRLLRGASTIAVLREVCQIVLTIMHGVGLHGTVALLRTWADNIIYAY